MNYIKRFSLIVVAVLVLACSVPLSSMAVDPVSAATMANAFAQAITAYGASQGVSMTFDVTNTEGIGEGVHDLWEQYASDMAQSNVTVSDYSNLAASVFPTLWKKTFDYVTVSLDAATVGEIDGFWNWLLSGPAEMTKVDNQYYEWTIDNNGYVEPISILHLTGITFAGKEIYNAPVTANIYYKYNSDLEFYGSFAYASQASDVYFVLVYSGNSNSNPWKVLAFTPSDHSSNTFTSNGFTLGFNSSYSNYGDYRVVAANYSGDGFYDSNLTAYTVSSINNNLNIMNEVFGAYTSDMLIDQTSDDISVQPYVGDASPQNVYIPDNSDVNYTPVAAEIPLDILWDDSLFGDGTGTLTDAQSEAITQAADDAITDNPAKTLELADTVNPPNPSPSEVYIPFLPVTLPSFQFSLSGIWHYVTAWVASLGAWFSLVFTTWSYLPYAISVPVYATAVIVIVLGVYKRFFM